MKNIDYHESNVLPSLGSYLGIRAVMDSQRVNSSRSRNPIWGKGWQGEASQHLEFANKLDGYSP